MASQPPFPHIDPSLYNWHPSTKGPKSYLRRALGVETKWTRQAIGPRQMFLSGRFSLTSSYSDWNLMKFGRAAKHAWLRLRFEFPEVILGPSKEQDENGNLLLELSIPRSDEEAREWVERSLFLDLCKEDQSAEDEIRQAVVKDPVCVRLKARVDQESMVAEVDFAFRVDHMTADGVGAYILAAYFFKFLAHTLSAGEVTFDWEGLKRRLPTPWVGMMNSEQRTEGKQFEDGVKNLTNLVMGASKSEWGMDILFKDGYMPKAIHRRISVKESNAILLAVKVKLGKAHSVTHLGHAAMVVTMLRFKPIQERPPHNDRLVSPLFINGRRYLDQGAPGSQRYISLCRAVSAIEFRDVGSYILSDNASEGEIQRKLRMACAEAFRSYSAIRNQKSLLTESFAVAECMARARNDVEVSKGKRMADAIFLSDGIIERYISDSYFDGTQSHKILEVSDVQFTANSDGPSLVIRISTFRQAINMSAEWNGAYYMEEDVRKFLDSVADLMLSLTRDESA